MILFSSENEDSSGDERSIATDTDIQLSTLPSPGNSDLDSDVDSMNTEILLESYYHHQNPQPSQGINFKINTILYKRYILLGTIRFCRL